MPLARADLLKVVLHEALHPQASRSKAVPLGAHHEALHEELVQKKLAPVQNPGLPPERRENRHLLPHVRP